VTYRDVETDGAARGGAHRRTALDTSYIKVRRGPTSLNWPGASSRLDAASVTRQRPSPRSRRFTRQAARWHKLTVSCAGADNGALWRQGGRRAMNLLERDRELAALHDLLDGAPVKGASRW
jgi:hypothetical protein